MISFFLITGSNYSRKARQNQGVGFTPVKSFFGQFLKKKKIHVASFVLVKHSQRKSRSKVKFEDMIRIFGMFLKLEVFIDKEKFNKKMKILFLQEILTQRLVYTSLPKRVTSMQSIF